MGIVTVRSGSRLSLTSTSTVEPSVTVYDAAPKETVTAGSSLSVMVTVVVEVVPAVTPVGGVPKPSATVSPSSSTVSSSAVKVNVLEVCPASKVTFAGTPEKSAASAPSPGVAVIGITTVRSGSWSSLTSTETVEPSVTVYDAAPKETVTAGSSLSVMVTVVVEVVPAVTPVGGVPKPSATVSPSSSTVSSSAVKVMVCDVSPLLKVTLAGTPEKSASSAPSPGVAVIGITTVRSGSASSLTSTETVEPSVTVYDAAPKETVTAGSSSSAMLTVVSLGVPAVTPAGRGVPKPSLTPSPSSLSASAVAMKVIVWLVSPEAKVTVDDTPE